MGLVAGTNVEAKMASLHDGTRPRDLLQGLVAGASPLVCTDLNSFELGVAVRLPSQMLQIV